jgi:hypothetical protein
MADFDTQAIHNTRLNCLSAIRLANIGTSAKFRIVKLDPQFVCPGKTSESAQQIFVTQPSLLPE